MGILSRLPDLLTPLPTMYAGLIDVMDHVACLNALDQLVGELHLLQGPAFEVHRRPAEAHRSITDAESLIVEPERLLGDLEAPALMD